jgi:hypothetical protein
VSVTIERLVQSRPKERSIRIHDLHEAASDIENLFKELCAVFRKEVTIRNRNVLLKLDLPNQN